MAESGLSGSRKCAGAPSASHSSLTSQVAQLVFRGVKRLNRIQSIVFETAYNTNENLLICAPTGAGKTNIAMLTVLHEIRQHLQPAGVIQKDQFKVPPPHTHTHTPVGSALLC